AAFIHTLGLQGAYWVAGAAIFGAGVLSLLIPDLPGDRRQRPSAQHINMIGMVRQHAHVFLTLGVATALVAALRGCRQIVIPLWAEHIGLDATTTALIYGLMGGVDMLLFYPAGKIMDIKGRMWIAVPSMIIMGTSLLLMPLTQGYAALLAVSMMLGLGNGIGSGIVMTIGADASPNQGRTQFLGIWREITDLGAGGGPLLLSAVTAILSLGASILVIGGMGYVAAYMFWRWLPRRIT
ncbi:MAG TPA: MFS transporter, partial [Castellaniella sp.]|nr:MFS transporter [Castellaniella sp.]